MSQQQKIQIYFTVQTEVGTYSDALYFDPAVFPTIPQSAIDTEIAQRAANYVNMIKNPPPPPVVDPQFTLTNEDGTVINV